MQIQRLEQKCPLTTVTEVPQRTFKLLPCSNLLLTLSLLATCSHKFPFIIYADENISHSSPTALPILSGREQRSCTIELNLNWTAYKDEGNDCQMWNDPVSCKDINRRNSYEQGLLWKAQERWTKLQNVSQQQPHAEINTFYSSVEQSLPRKILKHFLNAWWCFHPGEKPGSLSFINRNRGPGDKRLCYRLSRTLMEFGNETTRSLPSPFPTHQYYCPRWDCTTAKVNHRTASCLKTSHQ